MHRSRLAIGALQKSCLEGTSQDQGLKTRRALASSREASASEQYEYVKLTNGADGCPAGAEIPTFEECRQLGPALQGADVSACKESLDDEAFTISKASHPVHGLEARPLLDECLRGSAKVLLCERTPG